MSFKANSSQQISFNVERRIKALITRTAPSIPQKMIEKYFNKTNATIKAVNLSKAYHSNAKNTII